MKLQTMLDDVRVIDLAQYIPGPFATRQLADLGADVIKIEPPGGDPMRRFMHRECAAPSPVYQHLNRGKRICELDLKSADARDALAELIIDADVLLESYRPGVLARLGFDRERLETLNPRLIHCALSGYGQTGPYAQRVGHDINYCAVSSQSIVSGIAEKPVIAYPPIADHASALQAAVSILAALHARHKQGSSIYLDISITESILSWQYLPMLTRADERAAHMLNGGTACYNLYQCADGEFISLGAIETSFWKNFCHALKQPAWIERQFEAMPQQALIAEVAGVFAQQSRAHWCEQLDRVDCCFEALFAAQDISAQAQLESRQAVTRAGPTYPAWINHRPVEIREDFETIAPGNHLNWKTRPA
jgi:crotonobetainyl-CoA:carnitine CoA-transferase CaiB-like acyl-CoA transferase